MHETLAGFNHAALDEPGGRTMADTTTLVLLELHELWRHGAASTATLANARRSVTLAAPRLTAAKMVTMILITESMFFSSKKDMKPKQSKTIRNHPGTM